MGNGAKIKIWQDRWLPLLNGGKIITESQFLEPDAVVWELIDHDVGLWRKDMVDLCFNPQKAKEVLDIPLGVFEDSDTIHGGCPNGDFTVKMAYRLARELLKSDNGSHQEGSSRDQDGSWDLIWGCETPQKTKYCIWRLYRDTLPTRPVLFVGQSTFTNFNPLQPSST